MSFVECGGAVHFYERRSGAAVAERRTSSPSSSPVLVLVHALGTDHHIWDDVVAALPAAWDILRYDLRGHGLTEVGDTPYDIAGLSTDLAELLERLQLDSVMLCGLSVGGLVAQEFALTYPKKLRALCLCGTASRIGSRESWRSRIEQVRAGGLASILNVSMERWFGASFRQRAPSAVRGYRTLLERTRVEGYVATAQALADADLGARVRGITVPTLVIAAELDVAAPPAAGQLLSESIPGARFRLLAGASHLMSVECPEPFARVLTEFWAEVAALRGSGIG